MLSRAESVRSIRSQAFDVCIIGAGATGAGCALDAQLRGLRTVLIDAGDFASATSSASTKLVHGGVRYLEQALRRLDLAEFRVVQSALRERVRMLRNAPHLAHSCDFLIPCFSRLESLYYGVGVHLYDWISGSANLARSRVLDRPATLLQMPDLNPVGLAGSVLYTDGQFDDARYCLSLIQTFADAGGSVANYLKLLSFERGDDGKIVSTAIEDRQAQERFTLQARMFLNATGPFSDGIRSLAHPDAAPRLVLSRGVHILLPLTSADGSVALLVPRTEDGRVIFAIPWLGRLLVGTTDQEVSDTRESPVTRDEAEYLLRHLNRYLRQPRAGSEIVSAFSGVRPLVRAAHTQQTKRLIRDHEVEVDSRSGLISVLGGKWTTYRAMAEDATDHVQRALGLPVTQSHTANYLLSGAHGFSPEYASQLSAMCQLPLPVASHLARKFGSVAQEMGVMVGRDPARLRKIVDGFPAIEAEIAYSIRYEMAATVEDVLARRLGLQHYSWALAEKAAPKIANYLAKELGWSEETRVSAVSGYVEKLRRMQSALGLAPGPAAGLYR